MHRAQLSRTTAVTAAETAVHVETNKTPEVADEGIRRSGARAELGWGPN